MVWSEWALATIDLVVDHDLFPLQPFHSVNSFFYFFRNCSGLRTTSEIIEAVDLFHLLTINDYEADRGDSITSNNINNSNNISNINSDKTAMNNSLVVFVVVFIAVSIVNVAAWSNIPDR
ncbi:hypothetical protein HELRODRAFT_164462 [Helobdella robusta]|uniref:Uncharacterized protein n=1 Tax=Helobdella robusta TaxID=6412 RepID=T1EVG2_HELRO|nr:hypothetical protein HELRODRAFT_164462 [Helobdella robusta]ESN94597.1 hypothetical protein HELRODRAFT_164462 [Helobdella robusta]